MYKTQWNGANVRKTRKLTFCIYLPYLRKCHCARRLSKSAWLTFLCNVFPRQDLCQKIKTMSKDSRERLRIREDLVSGESEMECFIEEMNSFYMVCRINTDNDIITKSNDCSPNICRFTMITYCKTWWIWPRLILPHSIWSNRHHAN